MSYVFLCDVLIGKMSIGSGAVQVKEDCNVDNLSHPTIFCVPYDDAIFPTYCIAFHKNAKV